MVTVPITTLADVMPREFTGGEYDDTLAYRFRNVTVDREFSLSSDEDCARWKPWPGPQKNVYFWVLLDNGRAVGFNENPSRGWSFPVIGVAALSRMMK